jgi:hypothetical protein
MERLSLHSLFVISASSCSLRFVGRPVVPALVATSSEINQYGYTRQFKHASKRVFSSVRETLSCTKQREQKRPRGSLVGEMLSETSRAQQAHECVLRLRGAVRADYTQCFRHVHPFNS